MDLSSVTTLAKVVGLQSKPLTMVRLVMFFGETIELDYHAVNDLLNKAYNTIECCGCSDGCVTCEYYSFKLICQI
jgi:hypothetical protein